MRAIVALQQAQQDRLTFRESKEREMTKTRLGETRRQPSSTGTHKSLTSDADEADSPTSVISAHSTAVPPSLKSSGNPHRSRSKLDMELQLFLMKPIVQDFFDKIELTWLVHNPKMQDSAIRKYLAKNEDDGIPSVLDMLYTLHDYERTVVDSKMHDRVSGCEGSLLSLKRTKTEILHRNITLKDVPGLQFVVKRAILPPGPHMWNRREGMLPPPQPTIPYTISGYNYALQDQPMQLVIPEQQLKRKMSVDAGRKKLTRKWFSQGTHTPPPDVLDPQIPDEATTDEELFIPSSRAQASNRSHDQYKSYDRSESSIPSPTRGPTRGRDYHQAIPIRTNERPQLTASVNTSFESDAPSHHPLLASDQLQAKPSLGMAPIEQKGQSYPDKTSLPTTEESTRVKAFKARATNRAQDGNKENKKVLTGDVQIQKAPVSDPSVSTSISGAEVLHEPLYDPYSPSIENAFHEVPKNDSTDLPSLVKPKLRKRGIIKRRSFDKVVEVTNPKFGSSNSFERRTHNPAALSPCLHEAPRMSTSFFSDVDHDGDEVQLTPNETAQISEQLEHTRSFQLPGDSIPKTASVIDSESEVTNPSIIEGHVSEYQIGDQEQWTYEPNSPRFSRRRGKIQELCMMQTGSFNAGNWSAEEKYTDTEATTKGVLPKRARSTLAARRSRQRRKEQRSNEKPLTPSHAESSPLVRWQGPATAHYSLDQALPDPLEKLDFKESSQYIIDDKFYPQSSASETDDAPERVKDEGYGDVYRTSHHHSRTGSETIEAIANKMPVPRYSPGVYGKEDRFRPLEKAKTVHFSPPLLEALPPPPLCHEPPPLCHKPRRRTLSNIKISPLLEEGGYEEQVDLGKGDDKNTSDEHRSDSPFQGSRRRMNYEEQGVLRRRRHRICSEDDSPSPTHSDMEEGTSSEPEVDKEESEVEQEQEVDVDEEDAIVIELLGKYTTLFD